MNAGEEFPFSKSSSTLPTSGISTTDKRGSGLKRPLSLSSFGRSRNDQYVDTSPMVETSKDNERFDDNSTSKSPRSPTGTIPKTSSINFGKKSRLSKQEKTKSQECVLTKLVVAPSEIIDLQHQIHSNNFPDKPPMSASHGHEERRYQQERSREKQQENFPSHVAVVRRDISGGTNKESKYSYTDNFFDLKTTSSKFGTTIRYRDETDSERRVKFDSMEGEQKYQTDDERCVLDKMVIHSDEFQKSSTKKTVPIESSSTQYGVMKDERQSYNKDDKLQTSFFTSTPRTETVEMETKKTSHSSMTRVGVINK